MKRSALRLSREASRVNLFDTIKVHTDMTLKREHYVFYSRLKIFRKSLPDQGAKGYGRWAWKPFIIAQQLSKIPEGDLLLYIDAGCHFNWNPISTTRFLQYCDEAAKFGYLAMQLYPNEGGTGDLFEYNYNSIDNQKNIYDSVEAWESCQIQATLMFLVNNELNRSFVNEWLTLATEDNFSRLDERKIRETHKLFKEYRWDQSIFSLLSKKYKFNTILDETWWGEGWQTFGGNYPIWAMRHRSGAKPFGGKYEDLLDKFLTRMNL